jgi:hypothetical protein
MGVFKMTWRVTDSMLESMIEQLNDISKCRYALNGSYGHVGVCKKSMECTGISDLTTGNTKKELYYQLSAILDWHSFEKRSKADYIKNCTHHDVFNIHHMKEKKNVSHIHEYEEKGEKYFMCITCQKKFTKQEYEKSKKPKSADELREMRVRN